MKSPGEFTRSYAQIQQLAGNIQPVEWKPTIDPDQPLLAQPPFSEVINNLETKFQVQPPITAIAISYTGRSLAGVSDNVRLAKNNVGDIASKVSRDLKDRGIGGLSRSYLKTIIFAVDEQLQPHFGAWPNYISDHRKLYKADGTPIYPNQQLEIDSYAAFAEKRIKDLKAEPLYGVQALLPGSNGLLPNPTISIVYLAEEGEL